MKSAALAPNQSEGPDTGLRRLEILADGRKALNYWFSHSNKPSCGWEDGTLMFGEQSGGQVVPHEAYA